MHRINENNPVSLEYIEECLASDDLNSALRKLHEDTYKKLLAKRIQDIFDMDSYIVRQLDDLDKLQDIPPPISHRNIDTAHKNLANLVQADILTGKTAKHRAKIMTRYYKTALALFEMHDFHGVIAIMSGLSNPALSVLASSHVLLSETDKESYNALVSMLLSDLGLKAMQICAHENLNFLPNLMALRRKIIRRIEATETHSLERDYLEQSGKLKPNLSKTEVQSYSYNSHTNLIAHLEKIKKVGSYDELTPWQKKLLPRDRTCLEVQLQIALTPTDEGETLRTAKLLEIDELKSKLKYIDNKLLEIKSNQNKSNEISEKIDKVRNCIHAGVLTDYATKLHQINALIETRGNKQQSAFGTLRNLLKSEDPTTKYVIEIKEILNKLTELTKNLEGNRKSTESHNSSNSNISLPKSATTIGINETKVPLTNDTKNTRPKKGSDVSAGSRTATDDMSDLSKEIEAAEKLANDPKNTIGYSVKKTNRLSMTHKMMQILNANARQPEPIQSPRTPLERPKSINLQRESSAKKPSPEIDTNTKVGSDTTLTSKNSKERTTSERMIKRQTSVILSAPSKQNSPKDSSSTGTLRGKDSPARTISVRDLNLQNDKRGSYTRATSSSNMRGSLLASPQKSNRSHRDSDSQKPPTISK